MAAGYDGYVANVLDGELGLEKSVEGCGMSTKIIVVSGLFLEILEDRKAHYRQASPERAQITG